MFRGGTEVMVMGSSFKRTTGPKVGSLGFVAANENGARVTDIKTPKGTNISVCVQAETVFFTRYGFEMGRRCEVKRVLNIFPSTGDKTSIAEFTDTVNFLMSEKMDEHWVKLKKMLCIRPEDFVVMLVPYVFSDLLNTQKIELLAWVNSLIYQNDFANFMLSLKSRGHIEKYRTVCSDDGLVNVIVNDVLGIAPFYTENKEQREAVVDSWYKHIKIIVPTIQLLLTVLYSPRSDACNRKFGLYHTRDTFPIEEAVAGNLHDITMLSMIHSKIGSHEGMENTIRFINYFQHSKEIVSTLMSSKR